MIVDGMEITGDEVEEDEAAWATLEATDYAENEA